MNKNFVLCIIIGSFSFLALACQQNKQAKSSQEEIVNPEITCGLASQYAEKVLEARLENVPKWLIYAMEKLAYYTSDERAPVLHIKMEQAIDFTYRQDIPKDKIKKIEFMREFSQQALENCIETF